MVSKTAPFTLADFVAKWQKSTLSERAASQSHFIDLCHVLGQATPSSDPTGATYTFEKGVKKTGGGEGFADVWKRGCFAWEYKGKRKNLEAAYDQLLRYREDLENPPLLVVCDLDRFEVHTNFTNTVKLVYSFTLADLAKTDLLAGHKVSALDVLRALFEAPSSLRPQQTPAEVTEEAAGQFAKLAESLEKSGVHPEQAAHFLMRLLFCLFAEDVGLLPSMVFSKLVASTRTRPADFSKRLAALFDAMSTGGYFGADDIRYFDGGLFADAQVFDLAAKDLDVLASSCKLNWASVDPSVFGTLFERSLDPEKRSQLGAHYTSREDIMLVVEPVLMTPLRREWAEARKQAEAIVEKRDKAKGSARTKQQAALEKLLLGFSTRLSQVTILDPACGSGNFLYVSLRQLLDLEKEVSSFGASNGMSAFFPQVGPAQLHGIEINPYAHQLASIVVFIGFLQWWRDNGFGDPPEPVLKPLNNILEMDAILARDGDGKLVAPEWPESDVIVGNPPFLGWYRVRRELGDAYSEELFTLYEGRVPAAADLVCYWYELARAAVAAGRVKRVGLLATQGIRGGANRKVLDRIKETGDIFLAWSDRNWVLDGATVHVSIVGFDDGTEKTRLLDGRPVDRINADLTCAADLTQAPRLAENAGLAFIGDKKKGSFDIDRDTAAAMLAAPLNPNGRPNSDVVRPWVNARDITQRSRGMFIIDFGIDMPEAEAALYQMPFEYVRKHVKPVRDQVRSTLEKARWWLHGRPAPDMRAAIRGLPRYIVTPCVSKYRVFAFADPTILTDGAATAIARDDDYFLGMLHSRPHELWARAKGTQLREAESGCRYTPSTTFETYPFPWPPGTEPAADGRVVAIAQAAKELVARRDAWLNPPGAPEAELKKRTLTNLYNEYPTWLRLAHEKLDAAVFDAYGWPHDLSDDEILSRLLTLNLARAEAQGEAASPPDESDEE